MRLAFLVLLAARPVRTSVLDQPALSVVEPGAEPRRPLRYLPGAAARVATTSRSIADSTITNTTLDTNKQRLELPLIRRQLTITVTATRGELERTARVDDTRISADGDRDPELRDRFEVDVGKEKGTTRTTRAPAPAGADGLWRGDGRARRRGLPARPEDHVLDHREDRLHRETGTVSGCSAG